MTEELSALDKFGREFVRRVYDPSLWWADALVNGDLKGERAHRLQKAVEALTPEIREALHLLIPEMIEQVVFKALFLLDEEETDLKVGGEVVRYERGELAGWLFNDEGWIARFSQHKQQ